MRRRTNIRQTPADPLARWPGWLLQPPGCPEEGHRPDGEGPALVQPCVCEYYCDLPCPAYVEYCRERGARCRKSAKERRR